MLVNKVSFNGFVPKKVNHTNKHVGICEKKSFQVVKKASDENVNYCDIKIIKQAIENYYKEAVRILTSKK